MRLFNYNYGYNNTFNCSIHGTIQMTGMEWEEALSYLRKTQLGEPYETNRIHHILEEDIKKRILTENGYRINIRITATDKLIERYDLKNSKKANYQIRVITKIPAQFKNLTTTPCKKSYSPSTKTKYSPVSMTWLEKMSSLLKKALS